MPSAIAETVSVGGSSIGIWFCGSGPGGSETLEAPLTISAACGWEYPGTVAFNPDPANALDFECLSGRVGFVRHRRRHLDEQPAPSLAAASDGAGPAELQA